MFQVELVWNREFDFVPYGPKHDTLNQAITYARELEEMGGGERVKKTRIVDHNNEVVWAHGKKVDRT